MITKKTKWREEQEGMFFLLLREYKNTCLMCISHFCMWCSVFENNENVQHKWMYERSYIWTAEKDDWSSQLYTQLRAVVKAWKKFRPERDSNPWLLRYRCNALPTGAIKPSGSCSLCEPDRNIPVESESKVNIWKIIYLNCGERYEFMTDDHSDTHAT